MTEALWQDAALGAALFAVDPGTGGLCLRALPGPVRDRFVKLVLQLLPLDTPVRRLPLHAADDRLLGGLDLVATLRAGRPIAARGLLAEADGGIVLAAMAERLSAAVAARLGAVLDTGEVVAERDGMALHSHSAIAVIALDEGIAADERPPASLCDRLAFLVDLTGIGLAATTSPQHDRGHVQAARALLPAVTLPDEMLETLCAVAGQLGVASLRASVLAARVARAAAALAGRRAVAEADAVTAARLVLAPRATRLPVEPPAPSDDPPEHSDPSDSATATPPVGENEAREDRAAGPQLGEVVLEAARAALPPGLLAQLLMGQAARTRTPSSGGAGARQFSARRGRPIGERRGDLRAGARLNLVATLRAAAPWQRLRRAAQSVAEPVNHVLVTPDDFRITRYRHRTETVTIFVVDASGSAALNRLAEAKGAVELVLADCYVRRDRVALIAFRGAGAELLLPPTGSLVRAKRSLAALPGGGGTPLAAGLAAAFALADATRRKGQSPIVILLSDGRANVARDGAAGRTRAEADALAAAQALRGAGFPSVLVDTSPRPAPQARQLAEAMGARYLPLPYADADALARAVRAGAHV